MGYALTIGTDQTEDSFIIPEGQEAQYTSPETEIVTDGEGVAWVHYNGKQVCELGRKRGLPDVWVHPEPGYMVGRCKMVKTTGERCRNPVRPGWTVCRYHGAGSEDRPGGGDYSLTNGKYSKHLPVHIQSLYQDALADPDYLSMRGEMALMDTRLAELLRRMESADTDEAWNRVRIAAGQLNPLAAQNKTLQAIHRLLMVALQAHLEDASLWREVGDLIEKRRRVADTERRRIEAAEHYLTLPQANAFMARVISSVMDHVHDPKERQAISEELRVFAQG